VDPKKQTVRRHILLVLASAALLGARPVDADLIYFAKGGEVQLPATRKGTKIVVEAPGGPVEFETSDIRKLVPSDEPRSEWPSRLAAARKAGTSEQFAAAWWALENGLTPEATDLLRQTHSADPKFEVAARLVRCLDAITPPLDDPSEADLPASLGGSFQTSRSAHFLLYHQGNEAEIKVRLDLLERVYTTYYLSFAGQGLALPAPKRRLVGLIFASRNDYLEFLNKESATAFATTQGFYHPTRKLVVSFDPKEFPGNRSNREALDTRRRELAQWKQTIDKLPTNARLTIQPTGEPARVVNRAAAKAWLESLRRDVSRLSLLLDLERRSADLGIAAHETVHQLVADSGLAPRPDDFPIWLHEGLAAQFEVIRGGRWAGLGRVHDLRLPDYRSVSPAPRLVPIVRDEGFGHGYRKDLYAGAWALVYYLRKERPKEFAGFLDLLRTPSAIDRDHAQHALDLFRTSFGDDVSKVEGEWLRFMKAVHSPLEAGTEAPPAVRPQMPPGRD
jgi:hypothetical protein